MRDIPRHVIVQASREDMHAFREIYNMTADYVYNIAYRITGTREDAQEATQDVFLSIYKNLKHFRFRSLFKTWIYRIAVNTSINAYKRKARERRHRLDYNDNIKTGASEGSREAVNKKEDSSQLLRLMLMRLSPNERACIVLKDIEGLSYKEIADTLKIKINTVRSRLKRGREKLLALAHREGLKDEL